MPPDMGDHAPLGWGKLAVFGGDKPNGSVDLREDVFGQARVYGIAVCGNGFLYNMVRILAGELVAVGCGKDDPNQTNGFGRFLCTIHADGDEIQHHLRYGQPIEKIHM